MNLPQRILNWFEKCTISKEILEKAQIGWTGREISIPIFDEIGETILFYKYRRDPDSDEGPKYRYEKGSSAQLYNSHLVNSSDEIIVTEGEKDSLCALSHGFVAVSSTGGSGTFDVNWVEPLKGKRVYIAYDSDEAGIKGALRLQAMMPWAKCVWLPEKYKDVTEYFMAKKTADDFKKLLAMGKSYYVPLPLTEPPKKKKDMAAIIKLDGMSADALLDEKRNLQSLKRPYRHCDVLITYLLERMEKNKRTMKYMGKVRNMTIAGESLKRAKLVPIEKFIEFNSSGMALCIWHNEKSPSMHYYPETNHVKCFGCSKRGDSIDVIQQVHNLKLSEAITFILKNA